MVVPVKPTRARAVALKQCAGRVCLWYGITIRDALALAVTTEVAGHVGKHAQTKQDPVKTLDATGVDGDIHQGRPGQEQPAQ